MQNAEEYLINRKKEGWEMCVGRREIPSCRIYISTQLKDDHDMIIIILIGHHQ